MLVTTKFYFFKHAQYYRRSVKFPYSYSYIYGRWTFTLRTCFLSLSSTICFQFNFLFSLPSLLFLSVPPFLSLLSVTQTCYVKKIYPLHRHASFHPSKFNCLQQWWETISLLQLCAHELLMHPLFIIQHAHVTRVLNYNPSRCETTTH